jgi:hypothetical protein
MNRSQVIWGIVCLAAAALLAVLNLTLPPENFMFMVGDVNMPWVPPVVLGIVGVILLATARPGQGEAAATEQAIKVTNPEKAALNKRLETIAWALFLIMLGGLALISKEIVPKGVWSIGVGCIMLGLNAARYFNKIKMSGFTTFVGILSVLGGIGELVGLTKLGDAMFLILLGLYLIGKPWFEKRQLFGKAEESQ